MDLKSKILFALLIFLVLASAAGTYYRTMVVRDYPVIEDTSAESTETETP